MAPSYLPLSNLERSYRVYSPFKVRYLPKGAEFGTMLLLKLIGNHMGGGGPMAPSHFILNDLNSSK